jgi:class 3 adenylate cyclase
MRDNSQVSGTADPAVRIRDEGKPLDLSLVAANLPFVLRTFVGMAALVIAANIVGVVVIALTTLATNATASTHQRNVVLVAAIVVAVVQVSVGTTAGALVQRRTLRWLLRGERPTSADAVRALAMRRDLAVIVVVLWFVGGVAIGIVSGLAGLEAHSVFGICGGIVIGGLASAGLTYLLVGRVSGPVARLALASQPPTTAPVFGVRWQLFVIWLLTSGAPVVGIVLIVLAPRDLRHIREASLLAAGVALLLGAIATLLTARAIGLPLRAVVGALHQVEEGDLDIAVPVEDAGEIGLVQSGFNNMVAGLRDRERIQDLFGRHVGSAVAAQAITSGVTLRGETRDVVALFVDITGSTRLTRELEPVTFVDMLNRFFQIVVDEVERNGGLLNKFEGDAALCVFGAPVEIPDAATAALCTARAIRDQVRAEGEFDVGIGVAAGSVIAGQIGTPRRLEYTVIGDAVNEAARLTDKAKKVDGRILASESAVAAASEEEQEHWVTGRVLRLRGRELPTHTFRTRVEADGVPTLTQRLTDVAKAVAEFPPGR